MVKINVPANYGNTPKSAFIKQFNIAFVEGNVDYIVDSVTDDIMWQMVGENKYEGKEAFIAAVNSMVTDQVAELTLHTIITHGREGAANGEIQFKDGTAVSFCDVYRFRGAKAGKIQEITSYMIGVR